MKVVVRASQTSLVATFNLFNNHFFFYNILYAEQNGCRYVSYLLNGALFMRTEPERCPSGAAAAVEMYILPLVVPLVPNTTFFRLVGVRLAMPAD